MRNLMILCSVILVSACGPNSGQRSMPTASGAAAPETPPTEDAPPPANEVAADTSAAVTPLHPEDAALPPTPPQEAEPTGVEAKKRYRRGGGKVRRGGRAIELRNAVNGSGKRVTLESHKAPILVLTFGASWCAPCKKELPELEKLAKGYAPSDVAFVAVNIDSTIATGKTFMKRAGLRRVQAVYDPKGTNVQSYDPPTMPSVFIMKEGIVKHLHAGFRSGDERKLKKAIDRELQ